MRYVGIYDLQVAILSSQGAIEYLGAFSPDILKEKNLYITTGLPTDQVLRREVSLQLKRPLAVLQALPFQLESVLPFDGIIYPRLYPTKEGTDVVVFATAAPRVEHHLHQMRSLGIDPAQVSCTPLALARFARLFFPEEKWIRWIYGNTAIALSEDKVVFSQCLEDRSRLEAYLDLKFSSYFRIENAQASYQKNLEFAIPIGLALEGMQKEPCQFKVRKKPRRTKAIALSLGLAALVGVTGLALLHSQKQALEKKIATYFAAPDATLQTQVFLWQKQLLEESKTFPLLPDIPSVSDTLAFLGELQEPIDIVQFHYSLVKYPQAGEKKSPYSAKVELEFKAAGPKDAEAMQERLQKNPTLVDTKQKIAWTAHQNYYKISFWLRKNSSTS